MAEEHEEADEHRVDLSNGIYWRPVDYAGGSTMHDDCGFVGKDGVCTEISSSFAFADVWSSDNDFSDIDDEGREDPEEDLVDLLITKTEESRLPQNRHVVSPHRHDPPSAARIKVNAAVEEAVKNVSVRSTIVFAL